MAYYPAIGEVSSGTMRSEDLIDTFTSELSYHMKRMRLSRAQRKQFNSLLRDARDMSGDQDGHSGNEQCQSEIVDELFDALSDIAAPYCYFGAAEGDGACYGFWPVIASYGFDDDLPRHTAGEPIPRDMWGEDILIVNDHGNVDCGHVTKRGKFSLYWSVV